MPEFECPLHKSAPSTFCRALLFTTAACTDLFQTAATSDDAKKALATHLQDVFAIARTEGRMMPTPVRQLFETHLNVRDVGRSITFYRDVLGFQVAYSIPERGVAFMWVGAPGVTMLGLWASGPSPNSLKLHTAFSTDLAAVLDSLSILRQAGVEPLGFNGQPTNEPCVLAWMPAAAVYFQDPDGHSLEYVAMLPDAAKPELGVVSYSSWVKSLGRS